MRIVIAVVANALLGHAVLAVEPATAADELRIFQPAGPWAIEYADQSCRLARNFASREEEATLAFERFLPGPSMRLGVAGEAMHIPHRTEQLNFRFGPDGREQSSRILFSELIDGRNIFLIASASMLGAFPWSDLTEGGDPPAFSWKIEEELAAARRIDEVIIDAPSGPDAAFKLGEMEAPIMALQACIANLAGSWGLDMDRMLTATRLAEPKTQPETWIKSRDYPREMIAKHRTGVVDFRLIVDEDGEIEKCFVNLDEPGPFEIAVCEAVTKRARFTPALDGEGKPMPAIYTCSVRFVL